METEEFSVWEIKLKKIGLEITIIINKCSGILKLISWRCCDILIEILC